MAGLSPTRRQLAARLRGLAGVRRDQAAFEREFRRGRCAGRRCASRYAAVRITFDFRDPQEVIQNAELVCAACDRVWARTVVPFLGDWRNIQRHRIRLILRPEKRVRIWVQRGRIHREGDDAFIVHDANYALLAQAWDEWHKRNDRKMASIERRKAKVAAAKAAAEAEWLTFYKSKQAEWDARDEAARELGIA